MIKPEQNARLGPVLRREQAGDGVAYAIAQRGADHGGDIPALNAQMRETLPDRHDLARRISSVRSASAKVTSVNWIGGRIACSSRQRGYTGEMTEARMTISTAIEELVRLSVAEGNAFDRQAHEANRTCYEMSVPMSPAVRAAGERSPALAYAQTLNEAVPREGFIDEANEVVVMFPFTPEAIAAAQAEMSGGIIWPNGFAIIAIVIGGAEIYRGLFDGAFDLVHVAVGLAFIGLALLYRRRRRQRR